MPWSISSLRRMRDARTLAAGFSALVLASAFVFAAAPRLAARAADTALRDQVGAAPVDVRSVQLSQAGRISATAADPLRIVAATGAQLEARFPSAVAGLVAGRGIVVDTPRFVVTSRNIDGTTVRLRFAPDAAGHLRLVAGRLPATAVGAMPDPTAPAGESASIPVLEAALSAVSARALGTHVGETLVASLDPTDRLANGVSMRLAIAVVGIFEVTDPSADHWFGDPSLARYALRSLSPNFQIEDVTLLAATGAYPALLTATQASAMPLRYTWHYAVATDRLRADGLDSLEADLRRMENLFATDQPGSGTALQTGLLGLLTAFQDAWRSASAVLLVVALGPVLVALAAIALVAILAGQRRRSSLTLARARGASPAQVASSVIAEGAILTGPAAVLAALAAIVLLPADAILVSVLAAAGVALFTVGLLLITTLPATGAWGTARTAGIGPRAGPRRVAFEGLVIGLAALGALLLRQRGVAAATSQGTQASPDPFIAAVPALAGLAGGLLLLRAFPLAARWLARLMALRRDLVPVLAMRRATREGSSGVVLLVLVAASALGAFSSAVLVHLDRAADATAWQAVGAPFRVQASAGALPIGFAPGSLPGVEAAALAYRASVTVETLGSQVDLLAVDPPAYAAVTADSPDAVAFPQPFLGPASSPLPAVISSALASGRQPLRVGDAFQMAVAGHPLDFRVVAIQGGFPTYPPDDRFVLVSLPQVATVLHSAQLVPTEAFLRAPDGAAPGLRQALAAISPVLVLQSRAESSAALRDAPIMTTVRDGVALAALLAAAYAALAVAAALALAGAARALEVAHLRTMGLGRGESLLLVVVEHLPVVAVAFVGGVGLGLVLYGLTVPGLGLEAIIGSEVAVPLAVEPLHLALLLLAVVAIAALGIGWSAVLQRHAEPATATRQGLS